MATSASTTIGSTGKYGDLKRRLFFLLMALLVYRIGTHIPVPGIDPDQLRQLFNTQQGGILGLFNMFSGGALSRFSVFALGIMPYISASIIMQMLTYVLPSLEALRKEGESGRRKITQYTRYGTSGPGDLPGDRHLGRAGVAAGPGSGSRPDVPLHLRSVAGDRDDVPDVAGRADHGARPRQRHLDRDLRRHRGRTAERDRRPVRTRAHRRHQPAGGHLHHRADRPGDGLRRVRRARPAQDHGELRQAPGRQQDLRRPELVPAAQAQHVGRDPADLRFVADSVPGDAGELVHDRRRNALDPRSRGGALARAAAVHVPVCVADRLLLLLLYGARLQQQGDGGQPEEERGLRAGHPARASRPRATSTRS